MNLTTKAIVLRETDYRESDKILTLLTEEEGKLTVSARGCRKKNSTTAAVSQLLCYSDLTLYEFQGRWSIREGETIREFRGVRGDLEKLSLGAWFAELTEALTVEQVPAPEVLRLLLNTLYALEELDRPIRLIKAVFELKMMALAGFAPMAEACGVCGAQPEHPFLHLSQGVLHCDHCRSALGPGISMPLEPGALAALRYILYEEDRKMFSFRLRGPALESLSAASEAFVLTQMERGFRTLDFYKRIAINED